MAERRMFSTQIIESDAFLELPLSAQALYFHLCLEADDDGFINNAKRVQRVVEASAKDLQLLIDKRFLLSFNSGVVVIKHWRVHNSIRADRKKCTVYNEEMSLIRVKENGVYSMQNEVGCQLVDTSPSNDGQLVDEWLHSIDKVSIGKVSIDKREGNPPKNQKHKYGTYNNVLLTDEEFQKLKDEFPDYEKRIERVSEYCASTGKTYKNYLATIRNWAKKDKPEAKQETTSYNSDLYKQKAKSPIVYKPREKTECDL